MHKITPTLFLSSVLLLTLLPTSALALRIETVSNALASSSTSSSVVTTGRASGHRAVLRAKRLEWRQRATEGRPIPSSSSSAPIGTSGYKPYQEGLVGNGREALLYFYAPWSRNCQGMDDVLTNWVKDRPFVIPLYRVDYDTAKSLRATYGVKYANSYVHVDGKGTLLKLLKSPQEAAVKKILYKD